MNRSDHEISLKKKMIMGRVEPIKSLVPLDVKLHQHNAKVSSVKATREDTEGKQLKNSKNQMVIVA